MIGKYILPRVGIRKLGSALDAYSLRLRITAENVANVNTPGYSSRHVTFEDNLRKASKNRLKLFEVRQPPGSIPLRTTGNSPIEIKETGSGYFNGINDVDMEKEMTDLAKTSLTYSLVAKLTRGKFDVLKSAISGKIR